MKKRQISEVASDFTNFKVTELEDSCLREVAGGDDCVCGGDDGNCVCGGCGNGICGGGGGGTNVLCPCEA